MTIELYPAIDLYESKVIRLTRGDFSKSRVYSDNPLDVAKSFIEAGSKWIHLIDLEGAKVGRPVHLRELESISSLGCNVQYGGGLRSIEDIKNALDRGANRIYSGSLMTGDLKDQVLEAAGTSLVPSIDIKDGKIAIKGWRETVSTEPEKLIVELLKKGCQNYLVTSVSKDGTGAGPDFELYKDLVQKVPEADLIAAGGIRTLDDILRLAQIGLSGAILGTCLYEGTVDLKKALLEVTLC